VYHDTMTSANTQASTTTLLLCSLRLWVHRPGRTRVRQEKSRRKRGTHQAEM